MINDLERGYPIRLFLRDVTKHTYHWYNAITILYVIEGELSYYSWTGCCNIKENDLVILESRVVYSLEAISKTNKVMMVAIDEEYYKNLFPNEKHTFIFYNSAKFKNSNNHRYEIIKKQCENLFLQIVMNRDDIHNEEVNKATIEMLDLLHEKFDFISTGIKQKDYDEKITEIYRKLFKKENIMNDEFKILTLTEVAKCADISYEKLKKGIIYRYGYSYRALKNVFFTGKAIRMLLNTEESIMQIGYSSGFSDPKYLISCFKKYFGCTPSEFRCRYRKYGTHYENTYKKYDIDTIAEEKNYKNWKEINTAIIKCKNVLD